MNFKFKEKVNVSSFTFKKQVIEEVIDLLGEKKNYVKNDIAFYTMIAFLDNLIEENMLIEALGDDNKLIEKLYNTIEPLFEQHILMVEEYYTVFNDLVEQIEEYMVRQNNNRYTVSGLIYTILDEVGNMKPEEITRIIEYVEDNLLRRVKPSKKELPPKKEKPIIKPIESEEIANERIEALINEFKNKNNITTE